MQKQVEKVQLFTTDTCETSDELQFQVQWVLGALCGFFGQAPVLVYNCRRDHAFQEQPCWVGTFSGILQQTIYQEDCDCLDVSESMRGRLFIEAQNWNTGVAYRMEIKLLTDEGVAYYQAHSDMDMVELADTLYKNSKYTHVPKYSVMQRNSMENAF